MKKLLILSMLQVLYFFTYAACVGVNPVINNVTYNNLPSSTIGSPAFPTVVTVDHTCTLVDVETFLEYTLDIGNCEGMIWQSTELSGGYSWIINSSPPLVNNSNWVNLGADAQVNLTPNETYIFAFINSTINDGITSDLEVHYFQIEVADVQFVPTNIADVCPGDLVQLNPNFAGLSDTLGGYWQWTDLTNDTVLDYGSNPSIIATQNQMIFLEYINTTPDYYSLCVDVLPNEVYLDTISINVDPTCGNQPPVSECTIQSTLPISMGYDASTGGTLSDGSFDPAWRLTQAPPNPAGYTATIGGPARVIPANSVWTIAGNPSKYLNAYPTNNAITDNWELTTLPYVYERKFCVCDDNIDSATINFDLALNADNWAEVVIEDAFGNETPLLSQVYSYGQTNFIGAPDVANVSLTLAPGNYTIKVNHRNKQVSMGVNLFGTLTSNALLSDSACSNTSVITGFKFEDVNNNNLIDNTDQTVAGWTIFLYNQQGDLIDQTTTDGGGFYYFDVAPGSYVVEEETRSGWTANSPTIVSIQLGANQAENVDFLNFNNCSTLSASLELNNNTFCVGDTLEFTYSSNGDYTEVHRDGFIPIAHLGNGVNNSINEAQTLSDTGNHTISIITYNQQIGCSDTVTENYTVVYCPPCDGVIADFEIDSTESESGLITFTNTSLGDPNYWNWIGDTTISNSPNSFSFEYESSGWYSMCLEIVKVENNICCKDTVCIEFYVDIDPCVQLGLEASFIHSLNDNNITITNTTSPFYDVVTYNYGDGTSETFQSQQNQVSHTYTDYGTYTICVTAIVHLDSALNICCIDTYCETIVIEEPILCEGDFEITHDVQNSSITSEVRFDVANVNVNGTVTSVDWTFSDGQNGVGDYVIKTFFHGGTNRTIKYCAVVEWETASGEICFEERCRKVVIGTSIIFNPWEFNEVAFTTGTLNPSIIDSSLSNIEAPRVLKTEPSVFPNPVKDKLVVSFETVQTESVSINIISLTGKTVMFVANEQSFEKGKHDYPLNVGTLENGMYFVDLRIGNTRQSLKFIKQ